MSEFPKFRWLDWKGGRATPSPAWSEAPLSLSFDEPSFTAHAMRLAANAADAAIAKELRKLGWESPERMKRIRVDHEGNVAKLKRLLSAEKSARRVTDGLRASALQSVQRIMNREEVLKGRLSVAEARVRQYKKGMEVAGARLAGAKGETGRALARLANEGDRESHAIQVADLQATIADRDSRIQEQGALVDALRAGGREGADCSVRVADLERTYARQSKRITDLHGELRVRDEENAALAAHRDKLAQRNVDMHRPSSRADDLQVALTAEVERNKKLGALHTRQAATINAHAGRVKELEAEIARLKGLQAELEEANDHAYKGVTERANDLSDRMIHYHGVATRLEATLKAVRDEHNARGTRLTGDLFTGYRAIKSCLACNEVAPCSTAADIDKELGGTL